MQREELLERLQNLSTEQKADLIREQIVAGELSIHDVVALSHELRQQGLGNPDYTPPPSEYNTSNAPSWSEPEDPETGEHQVWLFTTIAVSGLAIAGVVAYMIAHHIAH